MERLSINGQKVRELGLERRETVWSLSTVFLKNFGMFKSVREDRTELTTCEIIASVIAGYIAKLKKAND